MNVTEIIEGELASDIYGNFMVLYDEGTDIEELKQQFSDDRETFSSNVFDYEICITVYALAFWEVGALTEEMLNEVKAVIEQKASINYFANEFGKEAGNKRAEALDEFFKNISKKNAKIKKRKRRKTKANLFEVGDVLSFQYPDKTYGVAFVADIYKVSGFSMYSICRTRYISKEEPTMSDFSEHATFVAGLVPSTDNIMVLLAWVNYMEHNDLIKFASSFNKIGKVHFQLRTGQTLISVDYEKFCDNTTLESEIAYTKKIGMDVGEYRVNEYIKIIE